ncbi:MAG: TonB-dependent receptor [Ignavibacteriae bacterium]|nr:TonB-dependent receptor [Ignavibacteriota bacterium]
MSEKIKSNIFIFAVILSLGFFIKGNAQQDSVKSEIKVQVTNDRGKKLSNALITIKGNGADTSVRTGSTGQHNFILHAGKYSVIVTLEGYISFEDDNVLLNKGEVRKLSVVLTDRIYTTDEIDVEGVFRQSQNDLRTSLFNVTPKNIKILPGAFEDVMRSLKSLPGISSPNDFTSQLVIRGSGPDQNLIIMDEVEIFNPYRLYGLVSMFNPETLSDINLITGGFPAKYGDRLSAVLDVLNREGTRDRALSFMTNINIASANAILQGKNPWSIPGSWIVSSRRTYYDLILGPFARKQKLISDDSSFPSFEDLQMKFAFGPFGKHKFIVNGIFSRDGVAIIPGPERTNPDSVNVNDETINNVVSLGWHYIPNANLISKTTLSWYKNKGDNDFEGDILDPLIDKENLTPGQRDSLKSIGALLGFNFASKYIFTKYSLGNRTVYVEGKNKYEFGAGVDMIKTDLTYTLQLDENFKAYIRSFPGMSALLEDFSIEGNNNYRANMYAQGRFQIKDKFYYQPSLRLDYYSFLKAVYVSPRINFGYAIDPLTTIRSAVGVYYQSPGYEKLVDNQTFYNLTGEAGDRLKAERSLHFILGVDRWLNNEWQLRVEGYYKRFDNLIVQEKIKSSRYEYYLYNPNNHDPAYMKNPQNWYRSSEKIPFDSVTSNPMNGATGDAYGIELSLEKKYSGPKTELTGWVNFSLSKTTRVRDGLEKPFRFDQPIIANAVLNYRFNTWFEIGARWSYATNFPYTKPVGVTPRIYNDSLVVNPLVNQVLFNLDMGGDENRFNERRPDYHRLDVRFTAYATFWKADWSFYLDVVNVYNRKNVLGYKYTLRSDLSIRQETTGMVPILPTLGISAKF